MVAIAIAVAAWIGYLSTQPEKIKGSDIKMEVFKVEIPEMPLCDAQHTANCYISKIDLEALSNGKLNH